MEQNQNENRVKQQEIAGAINPQETIEVLPPTGFSVIVREFQKDKLAMFSFVALTIFVVAVFIGAAMINMDALLTVDIFSKYSAPSFDSFWNFLGREAGGRSVIGLLIVGARNSIIVAFAITAITTAFGILIGLISGFYSGKVDNVIMRIVDFIGVLPTMMLIITIVSIVPKYNIFVFIAVMCSFYWISSARLVRSKTLSEGKLDYVNASKILGTGDFKIMFTKILPNISSIVIVDSTLALAANMGIETSLSFLGFGLPTSTPSLGFLISYAVKPEVIQYNLNVWLPASLVILFMTLSISYIGQALRRAADSKQRLG